MRLCFHLLENVGIGTVLLLNGVDGNAAIDKKEKKKKKTSR